MLELNHETVKRVKIIKVRKKDGAVTLTTEDGRGFNVAIGAGPGFSNPQDDRLVFGSLAATSAAISLLEKIIGAVFIKSGESYSGDNEIYIREN